MTYVCVFFSENISVTATATGVDIWHTHHQWPAPTLSFSGALRVELPDHAKVQVISSLICKLFFVYNSTGQGFCLKHNHFTVSKKTRAIPSDWRVDAHTAMDIALYDTTSYSPHFWKYEMYSALTGLLLDSSAKKVWAGSFCFLVFFPYFHFSPIDLVYSTDWQIGDGWCLRLFSIAINITSSLRKGSCVPGIL